MGFIQNQRCFLFTLLMTYKQFIIWLFQVFLPVHSPPSISLSTAGVVPKPESSPGRGLPQSSPSPPSSCGTHRVKSWFILLKIWKCILFIYLFLNRIKKMRWHLERKVLQNLGFGWRRTPRHRTAHQCHHSFPSKCNPAPDVCDSKTWQRGEKWHGTEDC